MTVYQLLTEHGLGGYYTLAQRPGLRVERARQQDDLFAFADEPAVRARLVDFSDARRTLVRLRVPAIHCIACVWLLENLHRLRPGLGRSEVHFPRREVSITFDPRRLKLSQVLGLLASIGYAPDLRLADGESPGEAPSSDRARLWVQVAVAGFAFGNAMLFSLPAYFGFDSLSGPGFVRYFGWANFLLALPVTFYSAQDYWRSAWQSVRQRRLQIEVPIALGLVALFGQSAFDIWTGRGEGYFDSLTGLVFFLLLGRLFQHKTYERLSFDRDYKWFFPISVARRQQGVETRVPLGSLQVGDVVVVRHGELVPADARLLSGAALIDYSFVTGESDPVEKREGDLLYAGGRQMGGAIEAVTCKAVSQSYLASLWNQEIFRKSSPATWQSLTQRFSRHFVKGVVAVAAGAALYWQVVEGDPGRGWMAFTAVLIVACPCALALAAPFALGTAQRELGRRGVFLKSPDVVEALSRVDTVVFDKTGTLTGSGAGSAHFAGEALSGAEEGWIGSLTRHSTHPQAVRLGEALGRDHKVEPVRCFVEIPGQGMAGRVAGHEIRLGSAPWLEAGGVRMAARSQQAGSLVHVAVDGLYRGTFYWKQKVGEGTREMLKRLRGAYEVALLSGDRGGEIERFSALLGPEAKLAFEQTPLQKLEFIRTRQAAGRSVMMVGDGLNDAGALKQGNVGVAVVREFSAFSPASDVIMAAGQMPELDRVLGYSRGALGVVKVCLLVSVLYNLVGVSIAAQGLMSPVISALLMPASSVTVVGLATGWTAWLIRRRGWRSPKAAQGWRRESPIGVGLDKPMVPEVAA